MIGLWVLYTYTHLWLYCDPPSQFDPVQLSRLLRYDSLIYPSFKQDGLSGIFSGLSSSTHACGTSSIDAHLKKRWIQGMLMWLFMRCFCPFMDFRTLDMMWIAYDRVVLCGFSLHEIRPCFNVYLSCMYWCHFHRILKIKDPSKQFSCVGNV